MQPIIIFSSWSHASLITSLASQHLSEWFKARGDDPIEMIGLSANRVRLARVMRTVYLDYKETPLVCYYGHGFPDSWVGFEPGSMYWKGARLVVDGRNEDWFRGCIVFTIACETAQMLGPDMIREGALSYFGSTEEMIVGGFEENKEYISDFVDVFTVIPKLLREGHTTEEALNGYRTLANNYIADYSGHPEWSNVDYYADSMKKNLDHYTLLGSRTARWLPK